MTRVDIALKQVKLNWLWVTPRLFVIPADSYVL